MKRALLAGIAVLGSGIGCDNGATTAPVSQPSSDQIEVAAPSTTVASLESGLSLPYTGTVSSSGPGFQIKQAGDGIAGRFEITKLFSSQIALEGVTAGSGYGLLAWNRGRGQGAAILTSNTSNTLPALDVGSYSLGSFARASAMDLRANNPSSSFPAVQFITLGKGTVLNLNHKGTTGSLATFQVGGSTKIRFTRTGKGIFDGGTQTGGADVAEAFEVEGSVNDYEPGDVLVISTGRDRTVEKSREPYTTAVVGVYATKPGILLTERGLDDPMGDLVPLGVIGVIPTKVTSENGAIRRGDLLVSASTPGHAMLGTDRTRIPGAVIGRALEEFSGAGQGLIKVLVNVR